MKKSWTLTRDCGVVFSIGGGFKSPEHYSYESDVTPRIHQIQKPFFFLSATDDPIFGPNVVPIGHCYDNILIGVTKTGGHCCYIEGKYIPKGLWFSKPTMEFLDYFNKK